MCRCIVQMSGPERFALTFTPEDYTVTCSAGRPRFSGGATTRKPKLYIASVDEKPFYVGQTVTPMATRMWIGWNRKGEGGNHGYKWRHHILRANLDVWVHEDPIGNDNPARDVETVEAEIVFLIRLHTGQWAIYQTEIHFYQSTDEHRRVARAILGTYRLPANSGETA
jgi:hypothetical protein